jgi:hypothetical protein
MVTEKYPGADPEELPVSYGRTLLVLMPIDPRTIHIYWEVTPEDLKRAKDRLGAGEIKVILRLHTLLKEGISVGFTDREIPLESRSCTIHPADPERKTAVELGLMGGNVFHSLARSEPIQTPRPIPLNRSDLRSPFHVGGKEGGETKDAEDLTELAEEIFEPGNSSGP